jgi:hypothetical protein
MWKLLAIALGTAAIALAVLVIWQLVDRARLRRRFAGILDLDRELATRRGACDFEIAVRLDAFEAEIAGRRRAIDAELANQTAEIELGRRNATHELADTMRRTAELQEGYASSQAAYDRLRAELSVLEQTSEDISFGLYDPIFSFASPEDYKRRLIEVRDQQRALIRDDQAVHYGVARTAGGSGVASHRDGEQLQRQYAKLLLRAFNGECDAAAAKVTWNNAARMIERVKHAFDAINKLGSAMQIELAKPYRELKLEELRLEHEFEQNRRDQQEEQRAIREQQREETHVQLALERERKQAEHDEAYAQGALDQAYRDLATAPSSEVTAWRARIAAVESELRDARQRKDRAILRDDQPRAGHVYILSNVGSFGETVYKIGMTRRDNPMERVHELSESVPFSFDVHAMIPSPDAPALEARLHRQFHHRRVNLVDPRRGFFHVTLDEIEAFARSQGIAIQLAKLPEARQYRETLELRRKASERATPRQVHDSEGFAFPAAL